MNQLCVVIPMKSPRRSKQRLANVLLDDERRSLATALFIDTLAFFNEHFPDTHMLVVSESKHILNLANNYGAHSLFDDGFRGLNGALESASQWVKKSGFNRQLIIPGDIALLDLSEVNELLRAANSAQVVLAVAKDGGTNALLTSPPDAITYSYGENSAVLHAQSALKNNRSCVCLQLKNIALDIDLIEDLYQAAKQQPARFNQWLTPAALCLNSLKSIEEFMYA
jgi:2-phospho-L-lactate guanylyltransferase